MKLFQDKTFSKWTKWKDRNKLAGIKYPGVYAVLYSDKDESEKDFSWRKHIIYIGMTNSIVGLKGRLKQFDNTIIGKKGHGGADRVRYKHDNYNDLVRHLYVSILYMECNVQPKAPKDLIAMGEVAKLEYICFAEYVKRFMDLPEFNNKRSPKFSLTKGKGQEKDAKKKRYL